MKIDGKQSKEFEEKLEIHQGSEFNPLLFVVVMNKITKDETEGVMKKLMYTDDLVLLGDMK